MIAWTNFNDAGIVCVSQCVCRPFIIGIVYSLLFCLILKTHQALGKNTLCSFYPQNKKVIRNIYSFIIILLCKYIAFIFYCCFVAWKTTFWNGKTKKIFDFYLKSKRSICLCFNIFIYSVLSSLFTLHIITPIGITLFFVL